MILPVFSVDNFDKQPTQFAAYVQDKIELAKTLILNAGLRYEYFDPASDYNTMKLQEYLMNILKTLKLNICYHPD